MIKTNAVSTKPPYLLGLLCLIPLVGAFVGIGLLLYGILKYKDKWLSLIGVAGIIWTGLIYGGLYYIPKYTSFGQQGFKNISQMQLNSLVKNVEFYKLSHGHYPDSLKQLLADDKLAPVYDAVQGTKGGTPRYYNYEKRGERYVLFSSGPDGIAHTKDDLHPQLRSDGVRIGLIR